mmetsp:Transcript_13/g.33  ORF Transcript_13/g.33 Transcript_13/m.33 type:complete len:150 (-) Transcript_13:272-721(-)
MKHVRQISERKEAGTENKLKGRCRAASKRTQSSQTTKPSAAISVSVSHLAQSARDEMHAYELGSLEQRLCVRAETAETQFAHGGARAAERRGALSLERFEGLVERRRTRCVLAGRMRCVSTGRRRCARTNGMSNAGEGDVWCVLLQRIG